MKSIHLSAGALAVACAVCMPACGRDGNPPGSDTSDAVPTGIFPAPTQTYVLDYPVDGVDLGQGWHREGVSKAVATCIEFVTREDSGQEQSMELSVVTDSSALMEELEVSAEAQFKSIGYSVSGKVKFAKDTDVRASSLNVLAHAKVMNGVEYVAPAESGRQPRRIDLTPHYRGLARGDRVAFEQECGDGFVAAVYSGAELTAMLAFDESDTKERTEIEAAVSGSAMGLSAGGAVRAKMEKAATGKKLRVTFYQTGGSGSPIPTTQDGFVSAIEGLPALAARDPYNYRIQVQSYGSLPGYPTGASEGPDEFRQRLATSYGRLRTLLDAVIEALEPTEPYVDFDKNQSAFHQRMQTLHDELTKKMQQIRTLAESCAFYDKDIPNDKLLNQCQLKPDLDLRDDYAYRLRLAVPKSSVTGTKTASDTIVDRYVRDVSRRRCERDVKDPGCLLESQIEEMRRKLPS